MTRIHGVRHFLPIAAVCALCLATPAHSAAPGNVWVCGYYLSGDQDTGRLPPEKIDFHALSHLIHFGFFPSADGTIRPDKSISLQDSQTVVRLAHAAGCKVLVSMGTDEGAKNLRQAMTDPIRPTLVRNLVDYVVSHGYDGLDLDFEPLEDSDVPAYTKLVRELRAALTAADPKLLLTAAVASQPAMFAQLQDQFDRIDLMTYDNSGPWPGHRTWYNASLYGAGREMMNKTEPYPSADATVKQYLAAGVPAAKLGIGVAFYGYVWSGVSGPKQDITGLTAADINDGADYRMIMDQYYQPSRYHWDKQAKAPYLSIHAPDKKDRRFISYDDERLCALKMDYVRKNHLGGVIIWELGAGYRPDQPEGKQDVLLQAIKKEWVR
jgi:chitinase